MLVSLAYPAFALLLCALGVFGIVRAVLGRREFSPAVIAVLVLWLLALFYMTMRVGSGGVRLNLIPIIVDGPGSARDALLNVAVFLPLGLLLATVGMRAVPVFGIALAVSLTIEVTQYLLDWGRTADVNDLITNVAGAGIGWAIARLILTRGYRDRRIAS
jgi:glycopeptide antibiotics resistance protein